MYILNEKSYNWVKWVELINSWKDWPVLWISVCTHWWEVVWLDILEELNKSWILKNILKWKLFLILNNINAYNKYIELKNGWKDISEKELVSTRFVDENMNRCCSSENLRISNSTEVRRVLELIPILNQLDIIFDIHSTYSPSDSMVILTKKSYKKFGKIFNVDIILIWITETQAWKPFIDIVERTWWIWIWIESGYQLDNTWYKIWLDNLLRLLINLWMVDWNSVVVKKWLSEEIEKKTIKVFWSIIVRWKNFKFYKDYKHLDKVQKWELFCFDWSDDIYSEKDFIIIMPKQNNSDSSKLIWEEWCFMWKIV